MLKLKSMLEGIFEDEETPAAQKAHEMGLVHTGYGQFAYPQNPHQVVAKSVNGGADLVKVEPHEPQLAAPANNAPAEQPAPQKPRKEPEMHTSAGWKAKSPATASPTSGEPNPNFVPGKTIPKPLPALPPTRADRLAAKQKPTPEPFFNRSDNLPEPGEEPEEPSMEAPPSTPSFNDKLDSLEAQAGGADRLRLILLKKVQNGDPKARIILQKMQEKERAEQEWAKHAVEKIQAKRDARHAALKDKYAKKYPRIDVDSPPKEINT